MEDTTIIRLYWERDERAIPATDEKYGAFCQRIAISVLDSREDAEECVNDTYHRAWMTIPPQRPDSLRAYLGRIIRNLAIDRYRRENAQKRFHKLDVSLSELEACLPAGNDPEQSAELKALSDSVNRYLGTLSKQKRIILLRRFWFQQSVEEIARDYGRSTSGIYTILATTRRGLREWLTKEGFAP